MAVADSSTQLGCGRDIDQVWDHLGQPPDAHESDCPHCRAARADLAALARATRVMRDDAGTVGDLQPSAALLDRIVALARGEVRRGRRLPLDQPVDAVADTSLVSEQALATIVRRVGDRIGPLQIRRCAFTLQRAPAPVVDDLSAGTDPQGVEPSTVTVALRVSAASGTAIVRDAGRLRLGVIRAIEQEVGMNVAAVHIDVEDLHDA